jgi:ABC-type uncharacterized transport system fused permease/ATPase subunit
LSLKECFLSNTKDKIKDAVVSSQAILKMATNTENSDRNDSYGFNCLYFKRFWNLQKSLFPSVCSDSVALLTILLVISGLEQFLAFKVGLISGEFYEVLGNKDLDRFMTAVLNSLIIIGSMTVVKSSRMFITNTMVVAW